MYDMSLQTGQKNLLTPILWIQWTSTCASLVSVVTAGKSSPPYFTKTFRPFLQNFTGSGGYLLMIECELVCITVFTGQNLLCCAHSAHIPVCQLFFSKGICVVYHRSEKTNKKTMVHLWVYLELVSLLLPHWNKKPNNLIAASVFWSTAISSVASGICPYAYQIVSLPFKDSSLIIQ